MIRIAATVLGAVVFAAAWLVLAPAQLGGSTGYVVLYGTSMEPRYGAGDLVLVRPARDVGVGDVVAYRHPKLGRTVLHRVVAREGERLQFKGDNNDFLDLPAPAAVDVLGREWVRVPALGGALERVRRPLPAAALAALCALLLVGGGATAARRRSPGPPEGAEPSPGRTPEQPVEPPRRRGADEAQGRRAVEALVAFAAVVALGLGTGAVAWSRPLEERVPWPGRWEHEARLSYGATVRPSPVYPRGRVATGDAVFTRQVARLRLRVDYRLHARDGAPAALAGTGALAATIRGDNGWRRTLPLVPTRELRGDRAVLAGELDLRALTTLARRVEALTGSRSSAYELTVAAPIRADGTVGDDAVAERFAPTFAFRLHDGRLEAVAPPADGATGAAASPWVRSQHGTGTRGRQARLALGAVAISVRDLRFVAVGLGLLALVAVPFGVAYVVAPRGPDRGELDGLEPWIVDLTRVPDAKEVRDVRAPEVVARLAERYGTVILRVDRPSGTLLGVEVDGILYRHLVGHVEDWPTEVRSAPVTQLRGRAAR